MIIDCCKTIVNGVIYVAEQTPNGLVTVGSLMSTITTEGFDLIGGVSPSQVFSCIFNTMSSVMPKPWNNYLLHAIVSAGNAVLNTAVSGKGNALLTSYTIGAGLDVHFFRPMLENLPQATSEGLRVALTSFVKS